MLPVAPPALVKKTIQITSQPPGARIEVSGDYAGDAPYAIEVSCDPEGRFVEDTRIRALPNEGGKTLNKIFFGYGYANTNPYLKSSKIPSRVFFDMRLGPANPEINVNVNE